MPQSRKRKPDPAEAIQELTETTIAAKEAMLPTNGVHEVAPIRGHRPKANWVRATLDWQDSDEMSEPLSAEIDVSGLSFANMIWMWSEVKTTIVWDFLATRVRNWNMLAFDHESNAWVAAPSPADIGWKAFSLVDPSITVELMLLTDKAVKGGDARPSFLANSASQPASDDATNSASA